MHSSLFLHSLLLRRRVHTYRTFPHCKETSPSSIVIASPSIHPYDPCWSHPSITSIRPSIQIQTTSEKGLVEKKAKPNPVPPLPFPHAAYSSIDWLSGKKEVRKLNVLIATDWMMSMMFFSMITEPAVVFASAVCLWERRGWVPFIPDCSLHILNEKNKNPPTCLRKESFE